MTRLDNSRVIRPATGPEITAKSWLTEAPMRMLMNNLDREVAEVDPIERAALRLAAYELKHRPDVPYRVVINEAIEVTKRFGADHGHSYVNGVLDKLAAELRAAEKHG